MDSVFFLDEQVRTRFLQNLAESLGCTYICLWFHHPLPSKNHRLSKIPAQSILCDHNVQFAAFVGCKTGEMEIGMSTLDQSKNIEMEMMDWFPDALITREHAQHPCRIDQSWPSSSSSSLKSIVSSPEYTPLMLNASNAFFPPEFTLADPQTSKPNQQIKHSYNVLGNVQFPNPENVDAELTRAMLAVLSSSPASSSSSHQHQRQHQQTQGYGYHLSQEMGAFRRYKPEDNLPALANTKLKSSHGGQDMLKRSIILYRNMHMRKRILMEEQLAQGCRPTRSQLHHKMSERKRREKLNDSFLALKSLLPPGSKKDKVSLLSTTRDYLTALKDEIIELKRRNRFLEAQLAPTRPAPITSDREMGAAAGTSWDDPVEIQLTQASEPSEEEEIDLQVIVRSGHYDFMRLMRRLLEFLSQVDGVTSLEFIQGNTTPSQGTNSSCRLVLRLKIKANQQQIIEESTFKEALRRIIGDVAK